MSSIKKFVGCAILAFVILLFGFWAMNKLYFIKIPSKNDISLKDARKLVAQGVKSSSSKSEVELWLKSKKIQYVYADSKKEDFNYSSPAVDSGIPIKNISGIIFAKIPNTERGIIAQWDIKIAFFFDKKGKLLKYMINKTSTGF